jgi:hypothetical protein
MDDIGSLFWRFGKKLIVSSDEAGHEGHGDEHHTAGKPPAAPPAIMRPPAAE